jgi:4-hydroxy-4-methyl-2-oxoglutarate aldolase
MTAQTGNPTSRLTTALVADALDTLGLRAQCLGADIVPVAWDHVRDQSVVGAAFTLQARPATNTHPDLPYQGLLQAMDDIGPDSVVVFATDRSSAAGVWGELITTACQPRGVVGAVTDGLVRDAQQTAKAGFPVFSRGTVPYDSKGRLDVVAHAVPVDVDGVRIRPGDLVVADADGVVIMPQETASRVAAAVDVKRTAERSFRAAVTRGASMREAFHAHRVL